jgi:two-component system chemotaxis response regulator CheB
LARFRNNQGVAYELVAIGSSWGGLAAYDRILPALPRDFRPAILIAQHRAVDSQHGALASYLRARSPLPVREVDDKDPVTGGQLFLAPPDYHTIVEDGHFALSTEGPVRHSRPSIDVAFETAADTYGSRLIGVLLTGANEDGADGIAKIRRCGGVTLVQDPEEAERPTMPAAAIATGAVDRVVKIDEVAPLLVELCSEAPGNLSAA